MPDSDTQSEPAGGIGLPLRRREDAALLRGEGRYVADVELPGALHLAFLRSPLPAGRIRGCDAAAAACAPGVAGIFGAADMGPLGQLTVAAPLSRQAVPAYPVLADGRVDAVGQPVLAVLADSAARAADAVEMIDLDIEAEAAGAEDPLLAEDWSAGDTATAFAAAAHVATVEIRHARLAPSPMECRAIAVGVSAEGEGVTVWLSSQTPHRARSELAAILGIDAGRIRVIAPDVGGAFGMKASLYPEEVVAVWAALHLRRPVRWTASRGEDLLAASHGRGLTCRGRLAVDGAGRFLALEAEVDGPLGHWLTTSAAVPLWNAGRILPGPYRVPTLRIAVRGHRSHTAPVGIYRGAGRPEAAMLMERLVEAAARGIGLDPVALRRRNLVGPQDMPWQGATGTRLDSGDYPRLLAEADAAARAAGLHRLRAERRAAGDLAGLGCALFVEPCGQGWESARVRWTPNGRLEAFLGGSSQGHGRETAAAQILADLFALPAEAVEVRHGDTATCPAGIGALASRSTPIGGSALLQAGREVLARLDAGARTAPVEAEAVYTAAGEAWGSGCHWALVAIDRDTGAVRVEQMICLDDAGRIVNPMLVEGQILGGVAQGLGEALLEHLVYDDAGQLLTGSLMDYALPRAADMPRIRAGCLQTPSPANLLGAKGVGEAGTIGAPAAIVNAVLDALAPLGVRDIGLPLRPETVWRAIRDAAAADKEGGTGR